MGAEQSGLGGVVGLVNGIDNKYGIAIKNGDIATISEMLRSHTADKLMSTVISGYQDTPVSFALSKFINKLADIHNRGVNINDPARAADNWNHQFSQTVHQLL